MTHKCSACGGSGYRFAAAMIGVAEDSGAWRALGDFPCPVCLGAGRFSDAMPIADSVADAETLTWGMGISYPDQWSGDNAKGHIGNGYAALAHQTTIHLAHAAFLAVPGLRG